VTKLQGLGGFEIDIYLRRYNYETLGNPREKGFLRGRLHRREFVSDGEVSPSLFGLLIPLLKGGGRELFICILWLRRLLWVYGLEKGNQSLRCSFLLCALEIEKLPYELLSGKGEGRGERFGCLDFWLQVL
jgi:hypothetical protein